MTSTLFLLEVPLGPLRLKSDELICNQSVVGSSPTSGSIPGQRVVSRMGSAVLAGVTPSECGVL